MPRIGIALAVCFLSAASASAQQSMQGVLLLTPQPKYEGVNCPEGVYGFKIDTAKRELTLFNNIAVVARTTITPEGTFLASSSGDMKFQGDFRTKKFEAWTERRAYDCRYTFDFRDCRTSTGICSPR